MTNFFETPVTDFDLHINRSIPCVDAMYQLCHQLTYGMSQEGTQVLDLGCSTGKFLMDTPKRETAYYTGVDRLDWKWGDEDTVYFKAEDIMPFLLADGAVNSSVVLALFTLQFLPFREREDVIRLVSDGLVTNGIFILAEKVHLPDRDIAEIVERSLIQWKRLSFNDTQILDKSEKLLSSMRCHDLDGLMWVMAKYFKTVNIVWSHGGFVCLVGVK